MMDGKKITVYGPYSRKDERKHVVLWDGIKTSTVSYPKFLMERKIGRKLEPHETVDHINGNFTDDRPENLQILTRAGNALKSITPESQRRNALLAAASKRGEYIGRRGVKKAAMATPRRI
jgi:hypothetical protein